MSPQSGLFNFIYRTHLPASLSHSFSGAKPSKAGVIMIIMINYDHIISENHKNHENLRSNFYQLEELNAIC